MVSSSLTQILSFMNIGMPLEDFALSSAAALSKCAIALSFLSFCSTASIILLHISIYDMSPLSKGAISSCAVSVFSFITPL